MIVKLLMFAEGLLRRKISKAHFSPRNDSRATVGRTPSLRGVPMAKAMGTTKQSLRIERDPSLCSGQAPQSHRITKED